MTQLRAGSATDVGLVRANNQDRLLVAFPLFAVADGMGGHAAGEVASATAVAALEQAFEAAEEATPTALAEAARVANRAVWDRAQSDPELRGMGTTLVALALVRGGGPEPADELAVVNVGDSRLYQLRHDELEQLTVDHSLVAELVAEGQLAAEEAELHPQRHVLTRALGVDPDVPVDLLEVEPLLGDRYLLCSDGLSREVSHDQMTSVLRRLEDPSEAARELVSEARRRGGSDNITVVVIDVTDGSDAAEPPSAPEEEPEPAVASDLGKDPTAALKAPADGAVKRPGWRARRRIRRARQARLVTPRVIGFVVLLLAVLGLTAAGIGWYARASYFVGLSGDQLVIFQGRPGGLLWFQPTVAERTRVTTSDVLPRHLPALRAGQEEPSLDAARRWVSSLQQERAAAAAADQAPAATSPTTTTVPGAATAATTPAATPAPTSKP